MTCFQQVVYVENYTRIKKLISFELQNSPQQSEGKFNLLGSP